MKRLVTAALAAIAVLLLSSVGPAAAQDEPSDLPPNWSSYDIDGSGQLSDAECAALSNGQADELRRWINVPGESGLFNTLEDRPAREWVEAHFEQVRYRIQDDNYASDAHRDNCGRVMDDLPGGGCGYLSPTCTAGAVGSTVSDAASNANPVNIAKRGFEKVAEQMADAYESFLETATTFWLDVPSSSGQSQQAISWLQTNDVMRTATLAVAVIGWIIAMVRVVVGQRGDGFRQGGFGLFRMLVVGTGGIAVVQSLLLLGDEWSRQLVSEATAGPPSDGLKTLLASNPGAMFMIAIVGIVTSIVQIVMMIVRNAAVIVLAGAWQITAGWSVSGDDTMWRRTTAWLAALVLYKPAAAVVYAAGFRLLHEDSSYGGDLLAAIQGVVLLGLAVLALPAMIRLVVPAASMGGPSTSAIIGGAAAGVATGAVVAGGGLAALVGNEGAGGSIDGGAPPQGGASAAPPLPSGSSGDGATAGMAVGATASEGGVAAAGTAGAASAGAAAGPAGAVASATVGTVTRAASSTAEDLASAGQPGPAGPSGANAPASDSPMPPPSSPPPTAATGPSGAPSADGPAPELPDGGET
ncbi:MAG: hypothetical protein ACK5OX_07650 [Desertimonas sp.]